jgi:fructan beta-fructosidase
MPTRPALPFLVLFVLLLQGAAGAEDILISDFEDPTYGDWKVEGQAFGTGPARGTLPGQMPVSGYLGQRLVNSFLGGDDTTGKLVSPPFQLQRKYINFLIGGGGYAGQTCINLLVDGKRVRTATGPNTQPGGSEALDWASWDVAELAGREAVIEIVDQRTGGWGHINVDHIVQSEQRRQSQAAQRELEVSRRYLHLPVKTGAPQRRMRFIAAGTIVREFEIEFAEEEAGFWVFADVSAFRGQKLTIEAKLVDAGALERITPSDELPGAGRPGQPPHPGPSESPAAGAAGLYQEPQRPQFHFTSRRGWLNDPNGLVYDGTHWHLFYQHNPYGWNWGNMHWGHAVSRDLVRWRERPLAIYPRQFGDWAFSGSAVVDEHNTSGFGGGGRPPLVAAFTSTGRGECIIYSTDGGNTWTEYEGNPVVRHQGRDPRLLWHAPTRRWVMAVYDEHQADAQNRPRQWIAFYTSPDLKQWEFASRIEGYFECPDLFELPIDGEAARRRWVLYAADGRYAVGDFDGRSFRPEGPKQQLWYGHFYAAQTFSNAPGGRRIQIGWARGVEFPGMPFNQQLTIPVELSLRSNRGPVHMHAQPVPELQSLRLKSQTWYDLALRGDNNPLRGLTSDLAEILGQIEPGEARSLEFNVRGTKLIWDAARQELVCGSVKAPVALEGGLIEFHVFVDRGSIEVFANGGKVAVSAAALAPVDNRWYALGCSGGEAKLRRLEFHELRSAWPDTP